MNIIASDLGDLLVIERHSFDPVTSVLENTWAYYRKKGDKLMFLGKASFRIRIYTLTELVDVASKAGWRLEAVYGSLNQDPFIPGRTTVNAVFVSRQVNR